MDLLHLHIPNLHEVNGVVNAVFVALGYIVGKAIDYFMKWDSMKKKLTKAIIAKLAVIFCLFLTGCQMENTATKTALFNSSMGLLMTVLTEIFKEENKKKK